MIDTKFHPLKNFANWEINESGVIRNILTGEFKHITHDSKGRPLVVMYKETKEEKGYAESFYISDLLHDTFGTPIDKTFDENEKLMKLNEEINRLQKIKTEEAFDAFANDNQSADKPAVTKRKGRIVIVCEDINTQYNGYKAAADAFGFNYDQFYNTFYMTKNDEIEFEGRMFRRCKQ